MNSAILELEQQDIELQLQEIQLKRKLNQMEREKITKNELNKALKENPNGIITTDVTMSINTLFLHYSKSAMAGIPRIADVCPDGSIKIYGKQDSEMISKKYSMKSLLWIRGNLHKWSDKQKETTGFFKLLAEKYTKRFVKISHITMESLCYLVDSGKADVWFRKYDEFKIGKQSTLKI